VPEAGDGQPAEPVEVPWDALPAEQLEALVESFVLREGTDYGPREFELAGKVAAVLRQLQQGKARILWDPGSESGTIVTADTLRRR
jgi:uncharacterized protein YheU (UPF0270 family)